LLIPIVGINIDLIRVEGKVGGKLEDTTLVNGIIIDKEMSHPLMKKYIKNAKIALLTCPFEPPKPKTKLKVEIETAAQYNTLSNIEQDYFVEMISFCKESGANIILCQWGFDDEPNHLLVHHNLPAIRWVGGVEIESISLATGAQIVPRFQELSPHKLGHAKVLREVGFGTTKDKIIVIEGCSHSRAVTLLVRGSSKMVVEETKRSLHDALCVTRNLMMSNKILYGGGAAELSCSLIVSQQATIAKGVEQYVMKSFANALERLPSTLAENCGLNPIETVNFVKARQFKEKKHYLGIDCNNSGNMNMKKQNVLETLLGKKQQFSLATQMCKMILKIDDVILPGYAI